MPISLPKIPKLEDLVVVVGQLDQRIVALEGYVGRNDERITALEGRQAADAAGLAEHEAGAAKRQREIDSLKAKFDRERWVSRLGRRR